MERLASLICNLCSKCFEILEVDQLLGCAWERHSCLGVVKEWGNLVNTKAEDCAGVLFMIGSVH